ncbi:hypothetical protein GCM10010361_52630 [Streptomyces olivaceiscleroticus]|uniref:Uncharacterized protein n=1 Tax=Streptomyces olivaceiscleroticus TaxID=68245 RepID=A0ABP3KJP4_9ACTN
MGAPCSGPSGAAEYWHIGAIHRRFGMVSCRRVIGSNSALTTGSLYVNEGGLGSGHSDPKPWYDIHRSSASIE